MTFSRPSACHSGAAVGQDRVTGEPHLSESPRGCRSCKARAAGRRTTDVPVAFPKTLTTAVAGALGKMSFMGRTSRVGPPAASPRPATSTSLMRRERGDGLRAAAKADLRRRRHREHFRSHMMAGINFRRVQISKVDRGKSAFAKLDRLPRNAAFPITHSHSGVDSSAEVLETKRHLHPAANATHQINPPSGD